jgi:hypothetical protein
MNARTIITIILAAFVVASVVYLVAHESGNVERGAADGPVGSDGSGAVDEQSASNGPGASGITDGVIAYYFHGDKRCRTCLAIEAYTKEAIEEGFEEQIGSGVLELRIVNVDEPANQHFIDDYELATKSVILAEYRDGAEQRWKNLGMIWEYVGDKEIFLDYLRRETEEYLGGFSNE